MASSTPNKYEGLDENLKLKRELSIKNDTSDNLYAALLTTEVNDWSWESKELHNVLSPNAEEILMEKDKEKIRLVLDNLRIRGLIKHDNFISKLSTNDFSEIKKYHTSNERTKALLKIIFNAANHTKKEEQDDIIKRAEAMVSWKDAEIGNNVAERLALKYVSRSKFRHYWAQISDVIDKNMEDWKIKWENCYFDVIQYAYYSSIWFRDRTWSYILDLRGFSKRNIPKLTKEALDALRKRIKTSDNDAEIFAIQYICDKLQQAFSYYKTTIWPSDAVFDQALLENQDAVYNDKRGRKKEKKENRFRRAWKAITGKDKNDGKNNGGTEK